MATAPDFNSAFRLAERLAFWDRYPLVGEVPIVLPCAHAPFKMYVENDDTVVKTLYWAGFFGGWEPASLRLWSSLAKTSRRVLDIGAYTGIYGLLAASSNVSVRVDCFEASSRNFERLKRNVALNTFEDRVRAIHAIVSDVDGEGTLYETYAAPNILSSVHSISKPRGAPVAVRSVSIDRLPEGGEVDLIKIDVEGAEQQVIAGMSELIASRKPVILLEANSLGELTRSWTALPAAYRCFAIEEDRLAIRPLQFTAGASAPVGRNYLFTTRHTEQELASLILV